MTLRFLRVLCASVVSLFLLSCGAYCYYKHQLNLNSLHTAWQETQNLAAKLDQVVDIRFAEPTTIHKFLAEWSRQTGVPAAIIEPLYSEEQQLPPFTLPPNCSACEALQIVAAIRGYSWWPMDNRIELCRSMNYLQETAVNHPLPPGLDEDTERHIAHALNHCSQSRDFFNSPDRYFRTPGLLTVSQPYHVQLSVERKLATLRAALEQCAALPPYPLLPDDPRVQPIRFGDNNGAFEKLNHALNERITLPLQDLPLKEFAARIGQEIGVPVVIVESRHLALDNGKVLDYRVNNRLRDVPVRAILRNSLGELGLAFHPDEGGRCLHVTASEFSYYAEQGTTKVYPVGDLLAETDIRELLGAVRETVDTTLPQSESLQTSGGAVGSDFGPLISLINSLVEPDSWDETGGPGRIVACRRERALLVTQRPDLHEALFDFLSRLRSVRAGQLDRATDWAAPSPEQQRLLDLLAQPFAMEYLEVSWENLIADLQVRTGLPIKLSKKIEDAGVKPTDPVTINLPARPLSENLRVLLTNHNLRLSLRTDHVVVTSDEIGCNFGPSSMNYELFDIRPLRSRPGIRAEIRQLVRIVITPEFWEDKQGPAFITEIGGVMVIQHEPHVLDCIRPLVTQVLADATAGKSIESDEDLLKSPAMERVLLRSGASDPAPVSHLYSVADLLEPHGKFSRKELLAQVQAIHPGEAASLSDAWLFELRLGRYLHVLAVPENAKKVEALLMDLRERATSGNPAEAAR